MHISNPCTRARETLCLPRDSIISQDGGPFSEGFPVVAVALGGVFVVLAFWLYLNILTWTGICRGPLMGDLMRNSVVSARLFLWPF